MAPNLRPGDRVILEIKNSEVFEGTIAFISDRSVEIEKVLCPSTNTNYSGTLFFYRKQVNSITRISGPPLNESSRPSSSGTTKKITMDEAEFNELRQMTYDFIFVDRFGKKFDDAVKVLSERESVAVVGLGSISKRENGLSLLVIADFRQIYLFDMYCLVEVRDLKDILESEYITKVTHDGGALYDCLYHKHKVEMRNVFDTKIVDKIISIQKENENVERNISECLTHYFNFPPSLLAAAVEDMGDNTWLERPILKCNKLKAAQLAVYLLTLRDKLMSLILKPYTNAIQCEYSKLKNISDSDLLKFENCGLASPLN